MLWLKKLKELCYVKKVEKSHAMVLGLEDYVSTWRFCIMYGACCCVFMVSVNFCD